MNIQLTSKISIHALHEESDMTSFNIGVTQLFQSTLSMRRATGFSTDDKRPE